MLLKCFVVDCHQTNFPFLGPCPQSCRDSVKNENNMDLYQALVLISNNLNVHAEDFPNLSVMYRILRHLSELLPTGGGGAGGGDPPV